MTTRWRWLRVRKGFVIQRDDREFRGGDLMRVPASGTALYAINTTPLSPGLIRRTGYGVARWWRLLRQEVSDVRLARRRAAQRRRRVAEAVRKRASIVWVLRR